MRIMSVLGCGMAVCSMFFAAAPLPAQSSGPAADARVEEILVTGRRSGVPIWRVHGPRTTIVLVGAIADVTKSTRWDPGSLVAALQKTDRVMFPAYQLPSLNPISLVKTYSRFKSHSNLPKGQTLASLMPPAQFQRLVALRNRGILKPGFERTHPFHVALALRKYALGREKYGTSPRSYVNWAVQKYKLSAVPIKRVKIGAVARDFFAIPAREHVPCLIDAIRLAEAGQGAIPAWSKAWAERRVPEVIASPAERVHQSCINLNDGPGSDLAELKPSVRSLLADPRLTVAVLDLHDLATRGGILDDLASAGFKIQGPAWR